MTAYRATLERLYSRAAQGRKLGLERVARAAAAMGNPERAFEAVHVGGTNGKGSVCAFVSSMLGSSGRRVGLYTSPHLVRLAERVQIGGAPLDDDVLGELIGSVLDLDPELTFFEVMTLAAFRAFQEAKVEMAVVEVGLGGRLDATNILPPPRIAAITRISFDHMAELGGTLAAIAGEKAGIIKPQTAAVFGKLHPDARDVLTARVNEVGARLVPLGSPEPVAGAPLAYPRMAMIGSNLAVAVTIGRELGLDPEAMASGVEATAWPGRNELLHRNGQELTLLDCAHNPDGAVALSHVIDPSVLGDIDSRRDVALVFGALAAKNWRSMLQRLDHTTGHRFYVAPPVRTAADPQEMAAFLPGEVVENLPTALARARAAVGSRGVVVVTGSTYLVGAARAALLGLPSDPAIEA